MKKIFSWLLLYTCMAAATHAQGIKVPATVTNAFAAKFPGAKDVKWGKESAKEYEAEFKISNTPVSANFNTDGSWTETETTIKTSELPAAVASAVQAKYPGNVISLAEKIEKPGNKTFYELNIKVNGKKKELELDAEGKFIK